MTLTAQNILIEGVKEADYRAMPGLNSSSMGEGLKSMMHLRYKLDNPDNESSESMEMGSLVHLLALQPERFDERYLLVPKDTDMRRNNKVGKANAEAYEAAKGSRTVVAFETVEAANKIVDALKAHKLAGKLMATKGPCEVVAKWTDPDTGAECKGRLDKFIPGVLALDLKTTRCADPSEFERSFFAYGYHRQLAWYADGFALASGAKDTPFVIVAVETEAPYGICVMQPDAASIDCGRFDNRKILRQYAQCMKSGKWPSYPEVVRTVGIPEWASKRYESEMRMERRMESL